ncbi:hypothetical protein NBRC116590_32260 [Pelagimonas sp. KU-00592-HH]|uniref:COG4223 family protein n=1 Tax=Pelagimonas sp. KU-00592-HH TaxID=3127651 RepID=UPI003106C2D8
MAKSDETDKPTEAQTEEGAKAPQETVDAEVSEETDAAEESVEEAVEDAVVLDEPGADEALSDDAEDAADEDGDEIDGDEVAEDAEPEPEVEPVAETPAPVIEEKKVGFVPVVLGGVVAAALGFGGATYLSTQGILFGAQDDGAVEALAARVAKQDDLIAALQYNQDKLSATADQALSTAAGANEAAVRLQGLSDRIETVANNLVALESRVVDAEKRPMTEGLSAAAVEAYEREVEDLRAMVAAQLEEARSLKANSEKTAQATLGQAALTRVVAALDAGAAYRGALTELASVSGVAIPAALTDYADEGVPTLTTLVEDFPDVAREALADARKQEEKASGAGRLGQFLKSQLGARSTTPQEGEDADAILSRAEAAVKEGRVAAALEELGQLPESSQALMAGWAEKAAARVAAMDAVETLAQSLNSN